MPLSAEILSKKLILVRSLVVAVVLAASLAAPVVLSADGVSAAQAEVAGSSLSVSGLAEEGRAEFVARIGDERAFAPVQVASSAGAVEVASVGSGGGGFSLSGSPGSLSSISSSQSGSSSGDSSSGSSGSGSSSGGSGESECPSGFTLSEGGSSCVRVESVVSSLVCPAGFERFSVGLGSSGWGCRRVVGEAVASFSCVEGVLRVSGGSGVCVWVVESVEVEAAVGSCSPGGVPPSCRYVDVGGVSRFGRMVFGCRPGWVLSGSSCSRVVRLERSGAPVVSYSCSNGVLVGSSCFEYAEPVRTCSPGWLLRPSGLCERTLRAARQSSPPPLPTTTTTTTTTTATTVVTVAEPVVGGAAGAGGGLGGPPGVPLGVRVLLGVGSGVLSWSPPAGDGGSPVVGYVLRWREGVSGVWRVVHLGASVRRYELSGLVGGGYYQVKLSARNRGPGGGFREGRGVVRSLRPCGVGERAAVFGGFSYCVRVVSPRPSPPVGLSLVPGVGSLTANWGVPERSEGVAAAVGFIVEWRRERSGGWGRAVVRGARSFTIGGLVGGVSYQVRVKSYSRDRKSSSAVLGDGVPLVDAACPSGVELGFVRQVFDPAAGVCVRPPGVFRVSAEGVGGLLVQLRWDGVRGVSGRWSFPSDPVSVYVVRWRLRGSSDPWRVAVAGPREVQVQQGKSSHLTHFNEGFFVEDVYEIVGLTNGSVYDVEVEARNAAGSSTARVAAGPCAARSEFNKSLGRCVGLPADPEGVTLTAGDRSLRVTWREPSVVDAAAPVTGFYVHLRNPDLGGVGSKLVVVDWDSGTPGVSGREWSYTFRYALGPFPPWFPGVPLTNGVSYRVSVTSINRLGTSGGVAAEGAPCADACATTAAGAAITPAAPVACPAGQVRPFGRGRCAAACPEGSAFSSPYDLRCATPSVPPSVGYFFVYPGVRVGTLDVHWRQLASDNSGATLLGYLVEWRRIGASSGWQTSTVRALPAAEAGRQTNRQYKITGLAVGARYQIRIAAYNTLGAGPYRYTQHGVLAVCGNRFSTPSRGRLTHVEGKGLCILPPHPPTGLAALPSASTLHVSWRQETWDNYHPVTGYKLRWRAGSTGAWTNVNTDIPWSSGADFPTPGVRRKDFTHTIRGLPPNATFYEIQAASYNQIPGERSEWTTIETSNCPTGKVRLTTSSGCLNTPALPPDESLRSPTVTLRPGSRNGALNAAWWQNTNAFNPSTYQIQWRLQGETTWSQTYLTPTAVNIPMPARHTARGWRLNSTELTGLNICTHEIRIFAHRAAQRGVERVGGTIVSAAPRGTTTAPDTPQGGRISSRSAAGDQLYVYWKRPECDGGAPLSEYKVEYKLHSGSTWTDATTITSASELARIHNGYRIGGLTQGTEYDVRVTAKNNQNFTSETSWTDGIDPKQAANPPSVSGTDIWRPYRMPPDQHARINERIQLGLTIRICTSAADFIEPLNRVIAAWNTALADNKLNNPGDTPTPRSDDAPAGAFEFSGNASAPADCGEEGGSGEMLSDNQGFEAVIMDYRPTCPATSSTCATTSCVLAKPSTETANNCADTANLCNNVEAAACVNATYGGNLLPLKTGNVQVAHMIRELTDRIVAHELGHYLFLVDYGYGCHRLGSQSDEASIMSYGPNWSEYQRVVNTQKPQDINCLSNTITKRDKEDLHAIYHPPAFGSLSIGAGRRGKEHFVVGSPPQDLDGNDYYNAYRYVILHRAPKGTNTNPNAFTQLMNGTTPVVFTPEQVKDAVDNNNSMLTGIDLADAAFKDFRSQGREFVFVGVTRGNPQRDPSKSLNPVSAAGLAHAVMTLNLGPNTGLAGEHKWTLGTPVSYIHQ